MRALAPGARRARVGAQLPPSPPAVSARPVRSHLYRQLMLLHELTDGMEVDQVLLIREAERRPRRDGGEYLRLQLGDRSGAVVCMVWEELAEAEELARAGEAVRVRGRFILHPRFGPQINLRALEPAEPGGFEMADLLDGPTRPLGQMEGEIALGYYRVRRTIEEIDSFPPELAQQLGHIILSHHGALEHGSPVVPCTREATLVHMIDNLGGRLGSFDRLQKELTPGHRWSRFDRALGVPAFFASVGGPPEDGAQQAIPTREAA